MTVFAKRNFVAEFLPTK